MDNTLGTAGQIKCVKSAPLHSPGRRFYLGIINLGWLRIARSFPIVSADLFDLFPEAEKIWENSRNKANFERKDFPFPKSPSF